MAATTTPTDRTDEQRAIIEMVRQFTDEQIIEAVRSVSTGGMLLAPTVTRRLVDRFVSRNAPDQAAKSRLAELTERETEVLKLVAKGHSNAEVAVQLGIGEATVKTHVARLLMKLELRDRVQVVIFAYESGLV